MKIAFRNTSLRADRLERIETINTIIEQYQAAGYKLTLRQLYYQLVSREIIPNVQKEYANLSSLLTDARMCGLVDWDAIEDRLRRPSSPNSWESPEDGLDTIIDLYQLPRQQGQNVYLEVWVEKDALSGVLSRVTRQYHVPILVNRGYSSASAMYDAYKRLKQAFRMNQSLRILYLGDFDPSGIDMIRDVEQRILEFFIGDARLKYDNGKDIKPVDFRRALQASKTLKKLDFGVVPIALTREQIDQHNPPPNPAKTTDPRHGKFSDEHGDTSWEVDALPPEVLNDILTTAIEDLIDMDVFNATVAREEADIDKLRNLKSYLSDGEEDPY